MPKAKQDTPVRVRRITTKFGKHAKKREDAAQLVADDRLTDEKIAKKLGISRATLCYWKANPEFAARVTTITAAHADRALNFGIARKENRLRQLNEINNRLWMVVNGRAADPEMRDVPGGDS